MKRFLAVAVVMAFAGSLTWAADDGAAIYKTKCAACHGAAGEGKMGPALKGTSHSADDIVAFVIKGTEGKKAPHGKPMSGLTAEQAKAVADFVKILK
jgi:mono/diheme cytochrome c family protein